MRKKSEEFDFSNIDFSKPVRITKFLEFEKNNPRHKLIVRMEDPQHKEFITKWFFSDRKTGIALNLFWDGKNHYFVISNLSGLLSQQLCGKHRGKRHICVGCDNAMKSRKALLNHQKLCFGNRRRKYPARNKETGEVQKLKFKNYSFITHHPLYLMPIVKVF